MACRAVIGRHGDRGLPSASAWFVRVHVCRECGLPSPCQAPRAHRLWVSLIDGSGPGSRPDIFAVNVRLIYALLRRGVWTNSGAFSVHRALIALPQVKALLRARPVTRSPAFPPRRAQARRRFTQVIHMVVHSKACNTFSSR